MLILRLVLMDDPLLGRYHLLRLDFRRMRAAMRDIAPERRAELRAIVGKDPRVVRAARDRDVGHAVVEQIFRAQLGIGMNQHTVGSLALGEWLVTA